MQSPEKPSSLMNSLPDDLVVDISARVPRFDYPNLSLVSKQFESLVVSPELYARRSLLGCTEPCIYVLLSNEDSSDNRLYFLGRKAKNNRLVFIQSLPPRSSIVAVDSKIYVFSKFYDLESTTTVLSIDCRSHSVQPLPSMPMPMAGRVIDIIDRKIYIIGYCDDDSNKNVIVVFDTETQMWEPKITKVDMEIGYISAIHCAVMADKIYMRDSQNSFVYEPKENKWETDTTLNSQKWKDACVIDGILFYYYCHENKLRAYDTKKRLWTVVKGVRKMFPQAASSSWWSHSRTVNYGGKLAVFLHRSASSGTTKIWCAKISLKRHQEGEILGKIEWSDVVFEGNFRVKKALVVMV